MGLPCPRVYALKGKESPAHKLCVLILRSSHTPHDVHNHPAGLTECFKRHEPPESKSACTVSLHYLRIDTQPIVLHDSEQLTE